MIIPQKELEKYFSYCELQKQLSGYTLKAYRIDLIQYLNHFSAMILDKDSITQYIYYLHENFKPKSVRRKMASLKAFARYLCRNDIISVNPFDKIGTNFKEPLRLPRTIPAHVIESILRVVHNKINSASDNQKQVAIRNAAVIELLFATGARVSEICSLKIDDVDLIAKTIKIFGKGSKERIIQVENDDVLSILQWYKDMCLVDIGKEEYFFLNNRKKRLSEQSVRTIIRNLEKQVNSSIHITPHMFRHSVATMLLEEDVDIRYIQKILGHSSITTTQIYTYVTSAKQKEILRTKHPRNKIHIE